MSEGKSLKNIIISGIFIIPFVGLVVARNFFFPFITPKNLFFRLIIVAIAACYAILIYKAKEYRSKFGTIGWAFLAFIIILFVVDIFGQYAPKSFFSNFERMEGFFTLFLMFLYYIVLTGVMKTERLWENLLNVSLASSVIMAIFALNEKSTGVDRLAAQLGNSTYLAAFMLFNMFFALFLILRIIRKKENANKWLPLASYGAIGLLDFYIFYNTGTRGALLGLVAGIVFIAVLFAFFEKHNVMLKRTGYGILGIVIITIGLLASFRNSDFVTSSPLLSRFSALVSAPADIRSYVSTQGKSRVSIWKIAMQGVKEKPILGWGQENFNYVFNEYYDPKIYDQEQWFDRAHNVFFDWLVAGGILGLLSYLSMFIFGILALWRKKRYDSKSQLTFEDMTVLTALLIAYFIHNIFVFDSITSYILFFTVLGYISIHEKAVSLPQRFQFSFLKKDGFAALGSTAFVLLSCFGVYYLVIAPYISSTHLIKALSYMGTALDNKQSLSLAERNDLLRKALSTYKTASAYGLIGRAEVNEQLLQKGTSLLNTEGVREEVKKEYAAHIDSELQKQLAETPNDARYFLFYAIYLSNTGRIGESFEYYKRAEELSPHKQSLLLAEGLAYVNDRKPELAIPIIERAFKLEESNVEARVLLAAAYIYAGNNQKAEEILEPIRKTDAGTDMRLMKAYYDMKQPGKISELLQIKLEIANDLYMKGDKEGAIREIKEVISINPAFRKEGEAFIAQIQASQ